MIRAAPAAAAAAAAPLRLVPVEPGHLLSLELQPAQAHLAAAVVTPGLAEDLLRSGPAWSVLAGDGRPVAIGGTLRSCGPPSLAWALLSPAAGRHMARLTRAVRRFLAVEGPVEAGVEWGWREGERWARALGFVATGREMTRWPTDGRPTQSWLYRGGV